MKQAPPRLDPVGNQHKKRKRRADDDEDNSDEVRRATCRFRDLFSDFAQQR